MINVMIIALRDRLSKIDWHVFVSKHVMNLLKGWYTKVIGPLEITLHLIYLVLVTLRLRIERSLVDENRNCFPDCDLSSSLGCQIFHEFIFLLLLEGPGKKKNGFFFSILLCFCWSWIKTVDNFLWNKPLLSFAIMAAEISLSWKASNKTKLNLSLQIKKFKA